jgi:hypothetical protein
MVLVNGVKGPQVRLVGRSRSKISVALVPGGRYIRWIL